MVRIVEAEHLFPHRIELACTVSPYLVKLREIVYALAVLEYRHLEAAQRIVLKRSHFLTLFLLIFEKYPDICLLRCLRKESEDEAKDSKGDKNGIIHVKNTAEAVRYLSEKEGNIFLTTGSKELVLWQGLPGHLERIFARVLPVEASVHICRELGYSGRHIIAMQGPFSAEMNYIQLKEFQCSYMVTKDGGDTGGFKEKMQAAKKAGATAVVIDRPKDKGMSLEQTKEAVKEWMKDVSE